MQSILPRGADIAACDLHGAHFQHFINTDVYLAPNPAFRTAMLARVPLAFTHGQDGGAIDQEIERAGAASIRQALNETRHLLQWHTRQHLHREASLDRRIAEASLPTAPAAGRRRPNHLRIKPDRQRSALLQCINAGRPSHRLVYRRGPTASAPQLSRWFHEMNPRAEFVQQSPLAHQRHSAVENRQAAPDGAARKLLFQKGKW